MHHVIDAWLTRFAAGAGSAYAWQLVEVPARQGRIECLLRARLSENVELCPLSAQATHETGDIYPVGQWRQAAAQQGLAEYFRGRSIALAADDDAQADPEVRTRLLRICQLL